MLQDFLFFFFWVWLIGIVFFLIFFCERKRVREYFWNSGFMVAIWPIRLLFSIIEWLYRGYMDRA